MYVFECEDSLEGIFTGIYEAYNSKLGHNNIRLCSAPDDNLELFCKYRTITPDSAKSQKVSHTLLERFGEDGYTMLCEAALSHTATPLSIDKAEAVYKTVVLGLHQGDNAAQILEHLSEPHVCQVFTLSRSTGNEAHHLLGFLRFAELENGLLFAEIHPKNYVLPILAEHFSDRLPMENFIIYDATSKRAALHKAGQNVTDPNIKNFLIADASSINQEFIHNYSVQEL